MKLPKTISLSIPHMEIPDGAEIGKEMRLNATFVIKDAKLYMDGSVASMEGELTGIKVTIPRRKRNGTAQRPD